MAASLTSMFFRAATKPLDEEGSDAAVMCEECGGCCLLVKHVSRCTQLPWSPVASTTDSASLALGRVAEGALRLVVLCPEESFDASSWHRAHSLNEEAPCALQWDKDRCSYYGHTPIVPPR